MKMNICGCLFSAIVLSYVSIDACADIAHLIAEEKNGATLECAHHENENVKWSRKSQGTNIDILTANGDGDTKHNDDPYKRYSSIADKSLYIRKVNISDSGLYYCNGEPAVELTVIPQGTKQQTAVEMTMVTLSCPQSVTGSKAATWSRGINGTNITYFKDNSLTISEVKATDSGLYYCNSKPAVYLNVIKTGTTTKTTEIDQGDHSLHWQLPVGVASGTVVFIIIIIIIVTWNCHSKRQREDGEQVAEPVYHEILDVSVVQPPPASCPATKIDHTYCIIPDPLKLGNNIDRAVREMTEPTYAEIQNDQAPGQNNADSLIDPTYSLIEMSNIKINNRDKSLKDRDNVYSLAQNPQNSEGTHCDVRPNN